MTTTATETETTMQTATDALNTAIDARFALDLARRAGDANMIAEARADLAAAQRAYAAARAAVTR